jgi:PLD-like domain
MKTDFVSEGVWKTITSAARRSRKPALVAVAYFAQGASKLLPLPPNSRLVVDASEGAVKSGQTCPADLKRLQKRGVVIYSYPDLHAKVYAFDGFAFVGSANVSNSSSSRLTEAVIRTTERQVVRSAKEFVQSLCLDELSPSRLDKLAGIYRPPRVPGGGKRPAKALKRKSRSDLPRLFLAQLELIDPPEGSDDAYQKGLLVAKSRRKYGRSYVLDDFSWGKTSLFRPGDKIVQVVNEGGNRRLIDAPADVIHTRKWSRNGRHVKFVYVELPNVRRISLDKLAKRLGYGAKKKLNRNGLVRDRVFAGKLLGSWSQF